MNGNGVGNNNGVMEMESGNGVGSDNGGTCGNGGASETVWDSGNGGTSGTVRGNGTVDGGGDMEIGNGPRHREELPTKRKPLRGMRRGKRNISKEEEMRLANAMKHWLVETKPRS